MPDVLGKPAQQPQPYEKPEVFISESVKNLTTKDPTFVESCVAYSFYKGTFNNIWTQPKDHLTNSPIKPESYLIYPFFPLFKVYQLSKESIKQNLLELPNFTLGKMIHHSRFQKHDFL